MFLKGVSVLPYRSKVTVKPQGRTLDQADEDRPVEHTVKTRITLSSDEVGFLQN